ncbi:hypothetical protein [Rubritalea tangerina]|uniref:hypothetical protein n=1 Tax=Rubritalea tangerina TaxID=430798 RepID=UPI00360CD134
MRALIKKNAQEIRCLHGRIHETFAEQPHGTAHKEACSDFHSKYDSLAFPGGYELGLRKIIEGDSAALESALLFLEVQPYFFRSQYIRTKLIRLLKRADLSKSQKTRFKNCISR